MTPEQTKFLIGMVLGVMLVQLLCGRIRAWWCWQGSPVLLGMYYERIGGMPAGEYPTDDGQGTIWCPGFRSHHTINVGIGLLMVRVHWFGKVPKEWPNKIPPTE